MSSMGCGDKTRNDRYPNAEAGVGGNSMLGTPHYSPEKTRVKFLELEICLNIKSSLQEREMLEDVGLVPFADESGG